MRPLAVVLLLAVGITAAAQDDPPSAPPLLTPADMVVFAQRDLDALSPRSGTASAVDIRPHIRYLALFNTAEEGRQGYARLLAGHLNGLNLEPALVPLGTDPRFPLGAITIVPDTRGSLLRINIDDFGWDPNTWEQLAQVDPFFHVFLQVENHDEASYGDPSPDSYEDGYVYRTDSGDFTKRGGFWLSPQGERCRLLETGNVDDQGRRQTRFAKVKEPEKRTQKLVALAPWLSERPEHAAALQYVVNATQSRVPVVSGAWFFQQTAIQADRKPGYDDFLGIKNRDDFEKLIGFNAKVFADARREPILEATPRSRITQKPRRFEVNGTIGGLRYWKTLDNRSARDEHNPLRVLDRKNFKHDAEESFGPGPSGMWVWGAFAADGTRQDSAPDFIASDAMARANDRRIHVNKSCIVCHFVGQQSGLQAIDYFVRGTAQELQPLPLQSPEFNVGRQLRLQYHSDLDGPIEQDRAATARTIALATGLKGEKDWTPETWGKAVGDAFYNYAEAGVDMPQVEADLGIPRAKVLEFWDKAFRQQQTIDPVLANYLRENAAGAAVIQRLLTKHQRGVEREQWEESLLLAHLAIRGIPSTAVSVEPMPGVKFECNRALFKGQHLNGGKP